MLFALACAEHPEGRRSGTTPSAAQMSGAGELPAMRVYQDPATGRFAPPPAPTAGPPQGAPQQSLTGLVEVPSPRGGVVVHLQGRFNSYVVATATPDGGVTAGCTEHGGAPP